jgi:Mrp family chromosome partitioning ATPase
MSQRVKELIERFEAFNNEIIGFVENCSDDKWRTAIHRKHYYSIRQ